MAIAMTCPTCSKELTLADELAGQQTQCAACGETVTVPAGDLERLEQRTEGNKPRRSEWLAVSLIIGGTLIVGLVVLLLLLPTLLEHKVVDPQAAPGAPQLERMTPAGVPMPKK